jgi:hypothetical protein
MGSAAKFCLVAEGEADYYPRFGKTMEWDTGAGQAAQFRSDAFDRAPRLRVRVEEVAGDQEDIDLLGHRQLNGRLEGCELAFAEDGGTLAEIRMSGAQMDVGSVQQPQHRTI